MPGLFDFIGVAYKEKIKDIKKKGEKKSTKKTKECKDCKLFSSFRVLDVEHDYFLKALQPAEATKTIAFILSPLDFGNLVKQNQKPVFQTTLPGYNLLFLPFPKCYYNPFDKKESNSTNLSTCYHNFVAKELSKYSIDLIVLTPETSSLLDITSSHKPEHPGNWSKIGQTDVFVMHSLYVKKGYDNMSMPHLKERMRRYFDKTLAWQQQHDFRKVTTIEQLNELRVMVEQEPAIATDVETSGLEHQDASFLLKTIGIYFPKKGFCIGYEVEECMDLNYQQAVRDFIYWLFANKCIIKIAHNLKFEIKSYVTRMRLTVFENCEDTMFLSNLINDLRESHSLKYLSGYYFDGYQSTPEDFFNATFEDLWFYNCLDCYYTYLLWALTFDIKSLPKEDSDGLEYVYKNTMLPLCKELSFMELKGAQLDYDYLIDLQKSKQAESDIITEKIQKEYPQTRGKNLKSDKQLADILFVMLRYPILKKTDGGAPSTDKKVLQDLRDKHDCQLAGYLIDQGKIETQLSTFITPYIEKREKYKFDRVRSSYSQVKNRQKEDGEAGGTTSGRLSSSKPNLQNTPRDSTIKKMFIPTKVEYERELIQFDLSQAELRIGGSLANEKNMLAIYEADGDIHFHTGTHAASPIEIKQLLSAWDEGIAKKKVKFWRQNGKPCFAKGTKILVDDSVRYIEDVVYSRENGKLENFGTNERANSSHGSSKIIMQYYQETQEDWIEFHLSNGDFIEVTPYHMMIIFSKHGAVEKKEASEVQSSDYFITKQHKVSIVKIVTKKERKECFCITVEDEEHEILFVGQSGKSYRIGQCNFGLLYGGSHFVLMELAKYSYGLDLTEEQAILNRKAFFKAYPALLPWHEELKAYARAHDYVKSPLGRIRREMVSLAKDDAERDSLFRSMINSPVQGTCADFLALIWAYVAPIFRKEFHVDPPFPVLTVHDSLVWDSKPEYREFMIAKHNEACEHYTQLFRQTWLKCPMKIDAAVGPDWGHLTELGGESKVDLKTRLQEVLNDLSR